MNCRPAAAPATTTTRSSAASACGSPTMHEAVPVPEAPEAPPQTTWLGVLHGVVVWLGIAILVVIFAYKSAPRAGAVSDKGRKTRMETRLEGRIFVGAHDLGAMTEETARASLKGPRLAVVLGEISGPDAALDELNKGNEALGAVGGVVLVE